MLNNQSENNSSIPWYFWVIVAVAILWNALGTFLWATTSFLPDAYQEGLPEAHIKYVNSLPF